MCRRARACVRIVSGCARGHFRLTFAFASRCEFSRKRPRGLGQGIFARGVVWVRSWAIVKGSRHPRRVIALTIARVLENEHLKCPPPWRSPCRHFVFFFRVQWFFFSFGRRSLSHRTHYVSVNSNCYKHTHTRHFDSLDYSNYLTTLSPKSIVHHSRCISHIHDVSKPTFDLTWRRTAHNSIKSMAVNKSNDNK